MYQFTDDCLTGIKTIDDEHRKLFQLINEAIALTEEASDVTVIAKSLLDSLRNYAITHFKNEEAYMEQLNDPELPRQKQEHAAFYQKMTEFTLQKDDPALAKKQLNDLLLFLVRWLYRHILSSDLLIGTAQGQDISLEQTDPFAFTDRYKTGIALIDEQHRGLFEIINQVNNLIHAEFLYDKYDEIMGLLTELREYTEFHFADEEEYMKSIGYPQLEAQKRAHTSFVERLVEIDLTDLDSMDDNQQDYLQNMIDFLISWLSNHILKSDKMIGTYERESHS